MMLKGAFCCLGDCEYEELKILEAEGLERKTATWKGLKSGRIE